MQYFLCIFVLLLSYVVGNPIPIFSPPASWQYVHPKKPTEYILASFVGNGSGSFHPSINLAIEETELSLKDYVKAVKAVHTREPNTKWRDLGPFSMKAGQGRLTEISSQNPGGEIKVLQAIFVKDNIAYILTCSMLKKEFPEIQKDVLNSLQSLFLSENIYSALGDNTKETNLREFFAKIDSDLSNDNSLKSKQKQWELLQSQIPEKYSEMGGYWHVLAMKEGLARIMKDAEENTMK